MANIDNKVLFLNIDGSEYYLPGEGPIYYIVGGGEAVSDTEAAWTGSHPRISNYYEGLTIIYKIGIAGDTTTTLNINNLGAVKVVKNATSAISTSYPVNSIVILVYTTDSSGISYWKVSDLNTDNYVRVYRNNAGIYPLLGSYTAASAIGNTSNHKSYESGYTKIAHNNSHNIFLNYATGQFILPSGQMNIGNNVTSNIHIANNAACTINISQKNNGAIINIGNNGVKIANPAISGFWFNNGIANYLTNNVTHTFTGTNQTVSTSYTPAGTISKITHTPVGSVASTFTGTQESISVTGTPKGSINKPGINITLNKTNVSYISSIGTLPSLTFSAGTLPSASLSKGTLPSASLSQGTLPSLTYSVAYNSTSKTANITHTFSAGTLPSLTFSAGTLPSLTFSAGTLPTASLNQGTLPTVSDVSVVNNVTATLAANPTFTGEAFVSSGTFKPSGSVTSTFTGTEFNVTPTFTGTQATISHTVAPEGTISVTVI